MSSTLASACSRGAFLFKEARTQETCQDRNLEISSSGNLSFSCGLESLRTQSIKVEVSSSDRFQNLQIVGRAGGKSTYRPRPRPVSRGRILQKEDNHDDSPLLNEDIRSPTVRLLDADQNMVGIVPVDDALTLARASELDLVMIAPDAEPPVVRIMDYSKYRYAQQKKKRELQKKAAASRQELKELKMRINIDNHDYDVRLRQAQKFLSEGDKVKVSIMFKGREMEFRSFGVKLFDRFEKDLADIAVVEQKPLMEGRTMAMFLNPNKVTLAKAQADKEKSHEKEPRQRRGSTSSSRNSENGASQSLEESDVEESGDELEDGNAAEEDDEVLLK